MGIFSKMLIITVKLSWTCFMLSFQYYSKYKEAVMSEEKHV